MGKLSIHQLQFGVEIESNLSIHDIEQISWDDGWTYHYEHCGVELVSPILKGAKGFLNLRKQLKKLWKGRKFIGFKNCGLHVHVDISHFSLQNAKRLVALASTYDKVIFSLMEPCRSKNQYTSHCDYPIEKIMQCRSYYELAHLQKNGRYHGTNLYAFSKHGTVEFRYSMGTANWQKIYALIVMYLKMVALAGSSEPIDFNNNLKNAKSRKLELARDRFCRILDLPSSVEKTLTRLSAIYTTGENTDGMFMETINLVI